METVCAEWLIKHFLLHISQVLYSNYMRLISFGENTDLLLFCVTQEIFGGHHVTTLQEFLHYGNLS